MDEALDRVFGVPLEEFTATRNELARELTKAGRTDEAATVRSLSKPSVPVWVINQLARVEPSAVGGLLDAGDAMRKAQERVLGGGGAADLLRDATARQREAIQRLTRQARRLLETAGRPASAPTIERVAKTLQAASVDEEGRRLLASGRLTEELTPAGFEALGGLRIDSCARTRLPAAQDELAERRRLKDERRKRRDELRRNLRALEKAARAAEREADQAEAAAADARRRAEKLTAEAKEAERKLAGS